MNKRAAGVMFCLISAVLFSARYISAAIFMSNATSWSHSLFESGLEYVGTPLQTLGIVSLLLGISYILWGELSKKD